MTPNRITLFAIFLAITIPASAAVYTTTLIGVTSYNGSGSAPNFNAEFPVGSAWSATLQWDTAATPLSSTSTQAQFRLTEFELTLYGENENFTTAAVEDAALFTITNYSGGSGDYHSIQFTTNYGTEYLTDSTILDRTFLSLNITLEPIIPNGAASLTAPPATLDPSLYDLENSQTGLKVYMENLGWQNLPLTGTIDAIPEPSTYALMAGAVILGYAALRRRKAQ
ncbi:PEP-CTERM sorting domain-containing protein [Ruficoccus sp. ZRK36]|uniref:PEP-CTERM sorting domain-containing protein n=1 Tax=Ruficoccus sp. ZRK36 TaxID=2866311 RepID=UPI001C72FEFE|nr:PEP-CTERM sorting domain-containing protein [Ruficoccus sp. ZRK36]QYY36126.1 PEP-CTERM sorting domain-containing protein [Ruficoccus sp. ZRK36]